jgi:hypothetical protein
MRILLLALGIVLTSGCGGQNVKTENENQISGKPNKQSELLIGLWMSDMFLNKIEATKSVYINKSSEPKILGFMVKGENLKSNSATIYMFTSHEGGIEIPIYFNNSINKFVYDEKRSVQSSNFNESFELNLIDNNKLEVKFRNNHKEMYRKVEGEQDELRRLLFEGEYISIDNNKKFTFNRTGSLTGFDGKMSYEVIYDFGLNIEFDAIVIYKEKEGGNWPDGEIYKYEFDSDTLKLYFVNTNWETMNHKIGGLSHKLIKIN